MSQSTKVSRRLRAALVVASTASVFALLPVPQAFAYNTFGGHKLIYGVTGEKYWINSSAAPHATGIQNAWSSWSATSTPISYTQTATQADSRMDFYKVSSVNDWWGITTFYVGSNTVDPEGTDWSWAKVRLDGDFANCPNKQGVIAHEVGHGMGLAHVFGGTARLMRSNIAYLSTTTPKPDDVDGINSLY
jgi:hypothetical protein